MFSTDDSIRSKVLQVWTSLLGEAPHSDTQTFFEQGGHSTLALRFIWLLRERQGLQLTLRDFMKDPSIAGIIERARPGTRS